MRLNLARLLIVASSVLCSIEASAAETAPVATTEVVKTESQEDLTPSERAEVWAYNWMVKRVPLDSKIYFEDAFETPEERDTRYKSIVHDVMLVSFDTQTRPLFQGPDGRMKTTAMLLAVMLHESSFLKHIDYGIGPHSRGDHGKSSCMLQVQVHEKTGRTTPWNRVQDRAALPTDDPLEVEEGYTAEDLVTNRQACIRAGMRIIRASFGSCRENPMEDRLALYTSGSCDKGLDASRNRMRTAIRMYAASFKDRKGLLDKDILEDLLKKSLPESEVVVPPDSVALLWETLGWTYS